MENKSAATTRKRKSMTNTQINIDGQIFNLVDIEPTGGRIKETSLTVEEICKRLESGAMCRDALLQRMENQWNKEKESHLILSALNERPLGAIIITGNGMAEGQLYEKQSLLDGLQRTTTLLRYTRNKFKLSKGLPPIVCRFRNDDGKSITKPIDISGMSFAQLPPLFQRRILDTKIDVNVYSGFSDEELDNVVFCVNNGTPFKPMQKLRTVIGSKMMKYIQPICDLTFWEKTSITAKSDNILGCVIRTLMLYSGYDYGSLSVTEMTAFAKKFTATESNINFVKEIENLFNQLEMIIHRNVPDEDYSFLTPCTIPHFIMNLDKYNSMDDLKQSDYIAFLNEFLTSDSNSEKYMNSYTDFVLRCHGGSGGGMYSRNMSEERQQILDNSLDDYAENLKIKKNKQEKTA